MTFVFNIQELMFVLGCFTSGIVAFALMILLSLEDDE